MEAIIIEDIQNFIEALYKYSNKTPLNVLKDRYIPKISIKKEKKKSKILSKPRSVSKHFIPSDNYRCIARCWGDKHPVRYNTKTMSWIYGKRCSRYKCNNTDFCNLHYKQFISRKGLSHGVFNKDPPHSHYNKYKNKIENRFKIYL